MNIIKEPNRIIIGNPEFFSAHDTLSCGQIFRFCEESESRWRVHSGNRIAYIREESGRAIIDCDDVDFFYDFFDFNTDYSEKFIRISEKYSKALPILKTAAEYGKGIRILNNNFNETVISFIISANNNIKRIQKIIGRLCADLGDSLGDGIYGFPSAQRLAAQNENYYAAAGCGYRSRYLPVAAAQLADGSFYEGVNDLSAQAARKRLLTILGVGGKVADCILLFGLRRGDVFPVDTWIHKIYNKYYDTGLTSRDEIRRFFTDTYGADSGLVQQYLFNYIRNNKE